MYLKIILALLLFLLTSCPTAPPLDPSDQYEAYVIPNTPESVTATNGYEDSITISWQAVDDATSYQVWGIEGENYGTSNSRAIGSESYNTLLERGFNLIEDTSNTNYTLSADSGKSYVFSIVAMRNISSSATSSSKQMLYSNPSEYVEGSVAGDIRLSGIANSNSTVLYYSVDGIESILTGNKLYIPVFSVEYKEMGTGEWKKAIIEGSSDESTEDFTCTLMASDNQLTANTYYDFRVSMNVLSENGNVITTKTSDTFTLLTDVNLIPESIDDISVSTTISDSVEITFTAPTIAQSENQYSSYFRLERSEDKNNFSTIFEGRSDSEELSLIENTYTYKDYSAEINKTYYYRVQNGFVNEDGAVIWQSSIDESKISSEGHRTWRAEQAEVEIIGTTTNDDGIAMTRNLNFSFSYEKEIPENLTFSLLIKKWSEDGNKSTKEEEEITISTSDNGTMTFSKVISTLEEDNYQTFSFSLNTYQDGNLLDSILFSSDEIIDLGRSLSENLIKTFSASDNYVGKIRLTWQVESTVWNEKYKFYIDEAEYAEDVEIEKDGDIRFAYIPSDGNEHEYRIEVEAMLGNVNSSQIYPYAAIGKTLSSPSGLNATDGEYIEGIEITFDKSEDEEIIYDLEYSEDDGKIWQKLEQNNSGSFFLEAKNNQEDGKTILFRLRSANINDSGNYTDWSAVEEGCVFGPAEMNLVAGYESSADTIELSWNAVTGADFYYIRRDGENLPGKVRTTSYSDESIAYLTPSESIKEPLSKDYEYEVIPAKDGDEEVLAVAAKAKGKLFSPPSEIRASKGELANYVHLTWDNSNKDDENIRYIVKRYNLDDDGNEIDVKTFQRTRNTYFDDTSPNGKAYYTVQAVDISNDLTSLFQNGFKEEENTIFKETEDANLGYPLENVGAPVIRTVLDKENFVMPYVQLIWERVDGATSYRIEPIINNRNANTDYEEEIKPVDVTGLKYDPESTEIITNGLSETEPGYLSYDPYTNEYTYNDNSGMLRTTIAITGYQISALHGQEESDAALSRSTVYRTPRTDEIVSIANEIVYKALHTADQSSTVNGDWFQYDLNGDSLYYYYPSIDNATLTVRIPRTGGMSHYTGDATFDKYEEENIGSISGSFTTDTETSGTDKYAAGDDPLKELKAGKITLNLLSITTATGESGNFKAAEISYPTIDVNSINDSNTYSVTVAENVENVNDGSMISRPF